jgi:hypothetical protein
MHRIYHDFNKLFPGKEEGMAAAPLVCSGTMRDLDELHLTLQEGMPVLLYQFDPDAEGTPAFLEVEATIRFEPKVKCFMADFVLDELKHRIDPQAIER